MNTYFLYCETIDNNGEVYERELVDICSAESYEECMEQSEWSGSDATDNEQYCIKEEDECGNYIGCYYPFGKANGDVLHEENCHEVKLTCDIEETDISHVISALEEACELLKKYSPYAYVNIRNFEQAIDAVNELYFWIDGVEL